MALVEKAEKNMSEKPMALVEKAEKNMSEKKMVDYETLRPVPSDPAAALAHEEIGYAPLDQLRPAGSTEDDDEEESSGEEEEEESSGEEEEESNDDDEESDEQEERDTLESQSPIIKAELHRIFDEIHKKEHVTWRIPKELVIFFVEWLEKAHDYFKFKMYLRVECSYMTLDHSKQQICRNLMIEKKNKFNTIDFHIIQEAVDERICQLEAIDEADDLYQFKIYLSKFKPTMPTPDILKELQFKFPYLSSNEIAKGLHYYMLCLGPKHDEESVRRRRASYIKEVENKHQSALKLLTEEKLHNVHAPSNPIYTLISQVLEHRYVMDEDPEVELEKIRKYDLSFSYIFMKEAPMVNLLYQARTLIVGNVALNASEQDIKDLFSSSGDIEVVHMESGDKCQTAHVTFKDFQGIESALLLPDLELFDLPLIISRTLKDEQRRAVKAVSSASSAMKKAENLNRRFNKALKKYNALRNVLANSAE